MEERRQRGGYEPREEPESGTLEQHPCLFTEAGRWLVFRGDDGASGNELWRTDGSEAGTAMVLDANPGGDGVLGF